MSQRYILRNDELTIASDQLRIIDIFPEEIFEPFVDALLNSGITDLSQLKGVSVYSFLNEKNVLYGSRRYFLLKNIEERLREFLNRDIFEKKSSANRITVNESKDNDILATKSFANKKNQEEYYYTRGINKSLSDKIEKYIISNGMRPVTIERIKADLDLDMKSPVNKYLQKTNWAVEIEVGQYIHRDSIIGIDNAAEIILTTLKKLFIKNSGYVSIYQLFSALRPDLDVFMFDNDIETHEQIYAITAYLFSKEKYKGNSFIFHMRMHIWQKEPDYPRSYAGLIVKWAKERQNLVNRKICIEKLRNIGAANPSTAFSVAVRENKELFWQYKPYEYLLSEAVHVDENWKNTLKSKLEQLLLGKPFVVLRSISDYWYYGLPEIPQHVQWTPLLLQEVLRDIGVGFRTIPAGEGQASDVIHAALTRKDSGYRTFGDVVWCIVDEKKGTPQQMESETLRKLLLTENVLKGNERINSLHKAIDDYRFVWYDNGKGVIISKA
jgi:hypothetical protein